MQAGDLKDFVLVEQEEVIDLDGGATRKEWTAASELYCMIEPVRAREYRVGEGTKSAADTQVTARYPLPEGVDVTRRTRLINEDRILTVITILDFKHRRPPFVRMMCKEDVVHS